VALLDVETDPLVADGPTVQHCRPSSHVTLIGAMHWGSLPQGFCTQHDSPAAPQAFSGFACKPGEQSQSIEMMPNCGAMGVTVTICSKALLCAAQIDEIVAIVTACQNETSDFRHTPQAACK